MFFSIFPGNQLGWNLRGIKRRKRWVGTSGSNRGPPCVIATFGWNGHGLGWPELILSRQERDAGRKKDSICTGNHFWWNQHGEKRRKTWV